MKSHLISIAAFVCTAVLIAASCATPEKLVYLQDMENNSQIALENKIEAVIVPYDELDIIISCPDPEIARPFNLRSSVPSGGSSSSSGIYTYLVDPNGNIQLPILGEIKASGLTRLQLQDYICQLLKSGGYLSEPFVNVRFYNFKVFFLGADGGKAITIPNERCTFLEALSLAGDINAYTRRDKIGIVREVNGKMTMHYLDPRSSNVFNDPYFMLQQNDIIVTRSYGSKYWRDEMSFWTSWLSLASSLSSIAMAVAIILMYVPK